MKNWIIFSLPLILAACGSTEKNEGAAQIPASMECPASQDASQGCPSPSNPAIPLGERADQPPASAVKPSKTLPMIEGRCEWRLRGEKSVRPCDDIKVLIRSKVNGEMREGKVDGFGIVFEDLNEKSYIVTATSEKYTLTSTPKSVRPGQMVLLRLTAKPIRP